MKMNKLTGILFIKAQTSTIKMKIHLTKDTSNWVKKIHLYT
jgi:hypothetical protein